MSITVENLMFLPTYSMSWELIPYAGQGTVILLPDGISTGTLISSTDERWQSWGSTSIRLNLMLDGPAAAMNGRQLMDLFRQEMGSGGWRLSDRGASISLRCTADLRLLSAMPHTCSSDPGRPCGEKDGGRSNSSAGTCKTPVDAEPIHLGLVDAG